MTSDATVGNTKERMPVYFCGICEYTTESKSSMDRHKARKKPCVRPTGTPTGTPTGHSAGTSRGTSDSLGPRTCEE